MGRMAVNTIATLVLSFVIAVILNQKFKGRLLCRVIFFLPVILSSGVLPGIENSNENYNLINSINQAVQESGGFNVSATLEHLLAASNIGGGIFDVGTSTYFVHSFESDVNLQQIFSKWVSKVYETYYGGK